MSRRSKEQIEIDKWWSIPSPLEDFLVKCGFILVESICFILIILIIIQAILTCESGH